MRYQTLIVLKIDCNIYYYLWRAIKFLSTDYASAQFKEYFSHLSLDIITLQVAFDRDPNVKLSHI